MGSGEARKAFDDELKTLQADMKDMASVVEDMLGLAIRSLIESDVALVRKVEDMDDIVDRYNLEIESRSLKLLALQQPMARDLRTIAGALKIITDIERAGDYAVDIAKVAEDIMAEPLFKPLEDIPRMASIVQKMLRETIGAFISRDLDVVQNMISHDDEVDSLYYSLYDELTDYMQKDPKLVNQAVGLLLISRYLERIADHITNIGERIYYMETGELKEIHI
ncbi:MAG: phosphate signaling complex protein PhoU [Armatimonadota bacterium]